MIEVEIKSPIDDPDEIRRRLTGFGATFLSKAKQVDIYYNAPHRDFAKTDEALRIRVGEDVTLTYKGPKLDSLSKTREEICISLGDADQATAMLKALDFKEVATVVKVRETYRLNDLIISIDDVCDLGMFIEIESMSGADYRSALGRVFEMLNRLGLKKENTIRESYLELILRR